MDRDLSHEALVIDELLKEVGAARGSVGRSPRVAVHGALDRRLSADSRREFVLELRSCLAEAAGRDDPSMVEITVLVGRNQLALVVGDDQHAGRVAARGTLIHVLEDRRHGHDTSNPRAAAT